MRLSAYNFPMKRRLLASICVSLFLTQLIAPSSAATKAGTKCTKLNSTTVSEGVKYTCIKSGTKLVWNKGVMVVIPTIKPTPKPTPTPTEARRPQVITLPPNLSNLVVNTPVLLNIRTESTRTPSYLLETQSLSICSIVNEAWVVPNSVGKCTIKVSTKESDKFLATSVLLIVDVIAKATPTATPTPMSTATPSVTVTVKPSATPAPISTPTVTPIPTPSPTATVKPSAIPTVTPTVAPTPAQTNSSTQSPFLISNTNLKFIFNNFVTLTTSGGLGIGAVTFSVTGANCTVNGNLLAANTVTKCSVTASKASSNGSSNTVSQPVIFEFTAQPLILGYTTPNGLVGQTIYLTHTGGSGNGRVNYISDGIANCSVWDENGLTNGPSKLYIRSTIAGTCTVTVQKAESPGFPLAQSQPVTFTFGTVNQPPLTISSIPTTIIKVGESFKLSATSGVLVSVTFSVEGTGCSIRTEKVTAGGIISTISYVTSVTSTNCNVTATSVGLGYNPQTSSPVSFPFGFYNQQPLSISGASTAFEGSLVSINSTGGSGTGAISFTVTGPNCSISGSNVTASAPTTCVVTGTKASKDGFNAITSQPISVVFQKVDLVDQQPLNIALRQTNLRAGEFYSGQTSGGSGTGAVTFTLSGQNCFIKSSGSNAEYGVITLSANDVASCAIVATKAGSIGFKPAQSHYVYVNFRLDNQLPISIKTDVSLTSVKGQFERSLGICSGCGGFLGITGGSGTGLVSYSASGSACSVSGNYLTATEETTCTVTATKLASIGYNAVSSQPVSFNFRIRDSFKLFISNTVLTQKLPSTFTLGTYGGGSGNGAITYSTSSAGCSISGNQLSAADSSVARTCVVYATRAASTGYYPTTSDPLSFRFDLP